MSDSQTCDQCQEDTDIKNMRYFPSDTHICIYCINPGFNAVRELSKCQNAYNELYEKTIWISVKDRLPEHNQFVLCVHTNGNMAILRCDIHMNHVPIDYIFMTPNLRHQVMGITHWMPLPELPK